MEILNPMDTFEILNPNKKAVRLAGFKKQYLDISVRQMLKENDMCLEIFPL